jgi:hypothetical protein
MTSTPMTATPALTFWDMPEDITRYIMDLTMPTLNELVLRVADKVEENLSGSLTDTESLDARRINQQYEYRANEYRLELFDIVGNVIASLDRKEYSNVFEGKSNASHYLYDVFTDTYDVDFVSVDVDRYAMRLVGYGNSTYEYVDSEDEDDSDSDY